MRWDEIPDDDRTVTLDLSQLLARTPSVVAHRVGAHRSELGEHPVAVGDQTVVWVDIERGEVLRSDLRSGCAECLYRSAQPVGFALPAPDRPGAWWVGVGDELGQVQLAEDGLGRVFQPWSRVPGSGPGMRLNDAAVSPSGTVWAGLMETSEVASPRGGLVRATPHKQGLEIRYELVAMRCPNGIGWSTDLTELLVVETETRSLASARYDADEDAALDWRMALRFTGTEAFPDGLLRDGADTWIAFWGAGAGVCFDQGYRPRLVVRIEDPHATSMAREPGGLFVTGATGLFWIDLPTTA